MGKTQVILFGSTGRMGKEISEIISNNKKLVLLLGLDRQLELDKVNLKKIKSPIVVIDFSTPAGFSKALEFCVSKGLPLVSGTTGLTTAQFKKLKQAGRKIPILWSPNMSVGINIILNLIDEVGATFKGFKVGISETHHKHKVDSPSGTAIALKAAIKGTLGVRAAIVSNREGEVVGDHKIQFINEGERIGIEHKALTREIFARGAVQVAIWLSTKTPNIYTMKDFINER